MQIYNAPLRDMRFVMHELHDSASLAKLPGLEDATPDLVCSQVTEEPFDHVEPGSRRRREADVESLVFQ